MEVSFNEPNMPKEAKDQKGQTADMASDGWQGSRERRKLAFAFGSSVLRTVTVFRRENGGDPSILWGF